MVDQTFDPLPATPLTVLLRWLGLAVAAVVAGVGAGLGFWQHLPALNVIFYTAAIFALLLWVWSTFLVRWIAEAAPRAAPSRAPVSARAAARGFVVRRAGLLGGLLVIILGFIILSLTVTGFFSLLNFLTALVLAAAVILIAVVSQVFVDNRSA